ncbi:hypothetical protein [Pseudoalteromonas sp. SG43-5]|uniref:hypothetical protein n=1 Tax=Pseudoalteromonas sp. SG43-5 TaxID=2760968 RepID=UPI0016006826|nr:hypothetical protein [Pseudoalteromonas sp. SG43-5]MBB1454490.1 hypothetical protein [Pseudoalteromonas sp. SG43-5]
MTVNLELLRTIFSGATLVSVVIAYFSLRATKKKQQDDSDVAHDKEIIVQAKLSLGWAYETIEIDSESNMPKADRLMWLTSARHILRYYNLRDSLKTSMYKTICAEHEEYSRHKFYRMFSNSNFLFGSYFKKSDGSGYSENIEVRSAMVLSIFSQWNASTVDPIDSFTKEELKEQNPYRGDLGRGIQHYQEILEDELSKMK